MIFNKSYPCEYHSDICVMSRVGPSTQPADQLSYVAMILTLDITIYTQTFQPIFSNMPCL